MQNTTHPGGGEASGAMADSVDDKLSKDIQPIMDEPNVSLTFLYQHFV